MSWLNETSNVNKFQSKEPQLKFWKFVKYIKSKGAPNKKECTRRTIVDKMDIN